MSTHTAPPATDGSAYVDTRPTVEEVVESLDGFEELAIEDVFGADVTHIARTNSTKLMRALAFVLAKRSGQNNAAARKTALTYRLSELDGLFADEDPAEGLDPDADASPAGKDDDAGA